MRIVIDARWCGAAAVGGIGRYTEQLIAGLQRQDTTNEYIALVRPGVSPIPSHPRWRSVVIPWRWYSVGEQLGLPRLLRQLQPDLVHFPHFNVPLVCPVPYVVTIHDLLLQQFPAVRPGWLNAMRYWPKHWVYRLVCRRAVNKAVRIITVSATVREQLISYYKIRPERVVTIANAPVFFPPIDDDSAVLLRYNINRPFGLYIGNAYPHKNIKGLLSAWAILSREWPLELVIAGPKSDWFEQLPAQIAAAGLNTERVRVLSGLADSDIAALYRQANVLAQPSLAEGFGLTGLEAMAAGCPVVCNDLPVFHEVYASAAWYASSLQAEVFAAALVEVIIKPAVSNILRAAGPQQAKQFSWDRAASAHQTLYHACQKNKKSNGASSAH